MDRLFRGVWLNHLTVISSPCLVKGINEVFNSLNVSLTIGLSSG